MPARLKRLELQGFKSFASSTSFVFDEGITAIIGPNGSGKSNIADALRWVLGEQSYVNLRGRRTEDVIFAGSSRRSPVGMAEVTVTLSNDDGSLSVPFSEVSVTRRAYRSGENQYLINGGRVRLKDVLQITASLGQAHTVIGQGLVDAVLSQRAEERRGLLEHAAGISGLRLKYAEAERHLGESQLNSIRLEDVLAEIEPRLKTLERAARQARERGQVHDDLQSALVQLFGWQHHAAQSRLGDAEAALRQAECAVEQLEAVREAARKASSEAATAASERRAEHRQLLEQLDGLRAERARVSHESALLAERRRSVEGRQEDLAQAAGVLERTLLDVGEERDTETERLAALGAEIAEREQALDTLESAASAVRTRRNEREAALRRVRQAAAAAERERAGVAAKLTMLREQIAGLNAERARIDAAQAERQEEAADHLRRHAEARRERERAEEHLGMLGHQREPLRERLANAQGELEQARDPARALERQIFELNARHDALRRLEESGAGLHNAVKAVLDAAGSSKLRGIVGTLAGLLVVPSELETAIEASLGGHLQDLVVECWRDAEGAIEHLKRTRAGRATFQPLDTVRAPSGQGRAPSGLNIRGVAADLIDYDPRVEPVVKGLLGRVLIAEDLDAAHAILRSLPGGWSVVTLGGEIARSSGTVTGGARVRESGILARERELRELPKRIRRVSQDLTAAQEESSRLAAAVAELRAAIASLERDIAEAADAVHRATAAEERAGRLVADDERAAQQEARRRREIEERLTTLATEQDQARGAVAAADAATGDLARELEELEALLDAERQDDASGALAEARAELRALVERGRALNAQLSRLADRQAAADRQLAENRRRQAALDTELTTLRGEEGRLAQELKRIDTSLATLEARIEPAQAALDEAVAGEQTARALIEQLENQRRELERERDRLELERSRRDDDLTLLLERAARELEVPNAQPLLEGAAVVADPAPLEGRINRLRERLRRIGLVAEDAVEQFERESERHVFLRRQLNDVRAAGESLRGLLAELDQTMDQALERTFAEVAEAFATTFTALFGGGKARLMRTSEEGGVAGLDIVAQPPGKRLQNLALLSGGERALTAVALLFAILRVNPSPFCLLDEVDAALDESNVVRVREELRSLSERTQFVVVTHNRATIEGADTLYGITMGDDGISHTLSLRLAAEAPA